MGIKELGVNLSNQDGFVEDGLAKPHRPLQPEIGLAAGWMANCPAGARWRERVRIAVLRGLFLGDAKESGWEGGRS